MRISESLQLTEARSNKFGPNSEFVRGLSRLGDLDGLSRGLRLDLKLHEKKGGDFTWVQRFEEEEGLAAVNLWVTAETNHDGDNVQIDIWYFLTPGDAGDRGWAEGHDAVKFQRAAGTRIVYRALSAGLSKLMKGVTRRRIESLREKHAR